MPAGKTYEPIATSTLSTSSTSVTFNSISGYTDLVLVFSIKANTASLNSGIRFNSDSGTNYSNTSLEGNGTTASSQRFTNATFIRTDAIAYATTDSFSVKIVNIQNYANSTTFKTTLTRSNTASTGVDALVGLWRNTNAITAIEVYARNDAFATGSTFTLYGILAA